MFFNNLWLKLLRTLNAFVNCLIVRHPFVLANFHMTQSICCCHFASANFTFFIFVFQAGVFAISLFASSLCHALIMGSHLNGSVTFCAKECLVTVDLEDCTLTTIRLLGRQAKPWALLQPPSFSFYPFSVLFEPFRNIHSDWHWHYSSLSSVCILYH